MPSEKDNILEFNQYMKSDKMPYNIYADIESLIKKIDGWVNNPENSSTTKERLTYSLQIFNANNLGIWYHRNQKYFSSRRRLYEKVC